MTIKQQGGVFGRNPTFNDVSVDDTLLVSGRIGVGTASPSTENALTLDGEANYNGILLKKSGSSVARIMQESTGNLYIDAGITGTVGTGKNLIIRTNGGSSVFTFKNSGNLAFASGNGIDFSATSGTGTSELFNDYEEGTWTPTVTSATGTFTTVSASGFYTKIGRVVSFSMSIVITDAGTAAGNMTATLPFAATSINAIAYGREIAATGSGCQGTIISGSSNCIIQRYDTVSIIGTGRTVVMTGTYIS